MKTFEHTHHKQIKYPDLVTLDNQLSYNFQIQTVRSVNCEAEYEMQMVICLTSDSTKSQIRLAARL